MCQTQTSKRVRHPSKLQRAKNLPLLKLVKLTLAPSLCHLISSWTFNWMMSLRWTMQLRTWNCIDLRRSLTRVFSLSKDLRVLLRKYIDLEWTLIQDIYTLIQSKESSSPTKTRVNSLNSKATSLSWMTLRNVVSYSKKANPSGSSRKDNTIGLWGRRQRQFTSFMTILTLSPIG